MIRDGIKIKLGEDGNKNNNPTAITADDETKKLWVKFQ
jgi:hypothetical protein